MNEKRTILVTGGAGFIGSHLVRRLVKDGYAVAVLTRETTNTVRIADVLSRVTVLRDDLSDLERLKKVVGEIQPHGIFHLAASNIRSGVTASDDELVRVNLLGTIHLIKALEGIDYKFFINSGSYLEYGTKERPFKETDLCEPGEVYALTKLGATLYLQAVAKSAGKPIVTFRIFSPYGPDMEPGRLFYEVVRRARMSEEIKLTKPGTMRDFIHVHDIVDLYMEAAEKATDLKGEVFNLGRGEARTLEDLVGRALEITGSKSVVAWGGAKEVAYDAGCQEANMEKTFSVFTWRPRYDLDAGIKNMLGWVKSS